MQSLEDGAKEMFAKEKSSTSYVLLVAPCFKHWKKKKKNQHCRNAVLLSEEIDDSRRKRLYYWVLSYTVEFDCEFLNKLLFLLKSSIQGLPCWFHG